MKYAIKSLTGSRHWYWVGHHRWGALFEATLFDTLALAIGTITSYALNNVTVVGVNEIPPEPPAPRREEVIL